MMDLTRQDRVKVEEPEIGIAREGFPIIGGLALLGLIAARCRLPVIAVPALVLSGFVGYFFRDPQRETPVEQGILVAPADGTVTRSEPVDPADAKSPLIVSIFLSIFDVHINRAPVAGRITRIQHVAGQFVNAELPESSQVNEHNLITIENRGVTFTVKQIAGLIARRCVLWKQEGDWISQGERMGLIKFGSRTEVMFPPQYRLLVKPGDRVRGGETIIAREVAHGK